MKTFRRDKLRRLIEAGKIVAVGSYSFDDMHGSSRQQGISAPVAMKPEDWRERQQGIFYLSPFEFTTKSGACWQNPDGTITLIVHGNSNYTFRQIEG